LQHVEFENPEDEKAIEAVMDLIMPPYYIDLEN